MVAAHLGVAKLGALLADAVDLADGGVHVDGQRGHARPCSRLPRPRQRRKAHPVQLADMPHENERRNVPIVEGASTRWPSTLPVDPARSRSQSSIHWPPARAEWSRVIALSATLARPGASPSST